MKYFFVALLTSLFLSWVTVRAKNAKVRKNGEEWIFSPILPVEVLFSLAPAMGTAFVIWGLEGPQADRTLLVSGGVLFILFFGLAWPKSIHLTSVGLRQRSWDMKWKEIRWTEITSVYKRQDSSIVVCGGRSGKGQIVFSSSYAGREAFLKNIREHLPQLEHEIPR